MDCPECKGKLNGAGNSYTCSGCGTSWEISFTCEKCGSTPEVISSCGSVSFFCETCKTVKSRETMDKSFTKN